MIDAIFQASPLADAHSGNFSFISLFLMADWVVKSVATATNGVLGRSNATHERIDSVMNLVINRELAKAERGMTVLATVASASVFVGLFGTVWGIMNAFRAIAVSQNTNLSVVAPGIAEALFATALGLIAAIPALIFYNMFTSDLDKYGGRLEGYSDELSAILSRKLSKGA